ncbi:hypothetical protein G6F52_012162 [Rhizopus delemar]|nr:hypothetical protein G6F52_012162 [Rhizopus delemar]
MLKTSSKTVLYGWGQTVALPLLKKSRVLYEPHELKQLDDYALPKEESTFQVATGWGHSLIGTSNVVYGFGLNKSGQLGTMACDSGHSKMTFKDPVKSLACGREHSHVVIESEDKKKTGLYSFGNNMYGQLGIGKNKKTTPGQLVAESQLRLVNFDKTIKDVACGLDNTVLTTEADGEIYAMGWGADGQLGQGQSDKDVPSKLDISCMTKKISSSTDYTLLLTNEKLYTWGNSEYGQGAQGKKIDRILEPVEIETDKDMIDVAAGGPFSVFLDHLGQVYTCGYGALGLGPEMIESLKLEKVKGLEQVSKIYASTDYAAALTVQGELFTWGLNGPSGRLEKSLMSH